MAYLSAETIVDEQITEATEAVFTKASFGEPWDTIITLGLVGLIAIVLVIAVIRKATLNNKAAVAVEIEPVVEAAPAPVAPGSAGKLKLHDVEPKTAAMLMAIIADKLGKPLNELNFISIKEVK